MLACRYEEPHEHVDDPGAKYSYYYTIRDEMVVVACKCIDRDMESPAVHIHTTDNKEGRKPEGGGESTSVLGRRPREDPVGSQQALEDDEVAKQRRVE